MNHEPNYELLREAYAIIGGIPSRQFDLDAIVAARGESLTCGTIACAGGWLAMHPQFQAMGLGVEPKHGWTALTLNGRQEFFEDALAQIFGISKVDVDNLFGANNYSDYDGDIPESYSDKRRWMARVRMFLKKRGQLTSQLEAAKA